MKAKKGQSLSGTLIAFAIGLGLFILINVFMGALSGGTYNIVEDKLLEVGRENFAEELTFANASSTTVTYKDTIYNIDSIVSNSDTYGLTNFTIDYTAGTITPNTVTVENLTIANVTYDYGNATIGGYLRSGVAGSFEGGKTLGEYTPLIVLSIVIFLVLVLVTQFTGAEGGGKNQGGVL